MTSLAHCTKEGGWDIVTIKPFFSLIKGDDAGKDLTTSLFPSSLVALEGECWPGALESVGALCSLLEGASGSGIAEGLSLFTV